MLKHMSLFVVAVVVMTAGSAFAAESCDPGSYLLAGTCTPAPAGSYAVGGISTAPIPCPAGRYSDVDGTVVCIPAPLGYFVDQEGQVAAQQCPAGLTTYNVGSVACVPIEDVEPPLGQSVRVCAPGLGAALGANARAAGNNRGGVPALIAVICSDD